MPTDADVDEQATRDLHSAMPFARELGVEVVRSERDGVVARVAWTPERCTTGGALHGAVLMGLADVCGGLLAFLNLPPEATGTVTLESKTNFLRAVRGGDLTARATPLHVGRTTIVIVTDLTGDDGRLAGRVTQTQAVLGSGT